jgi:hypothetical protein
VNVLIEKCTSATLIGKIVWYEFTNCKK